MKRVLGGGETSGSNVDWPKQKQAPRLLSVMLCHSFIHQGGDRESRGAYSSEGLLVRWGEGEDPDPLPETSLFTSELN